MRWITLSLMLVVFAACRKEAILMDDDSNAAAIKLAKQYFDDSVLNPLSHADLQRSASATATSTRFGERSVDWQKAVVERRGASLVVLVPLQYARPLFFRNPFNGRAYNLAELSRLHVVTHASGQQTSAVVTYIPDSIVRYAGSFTGLVLVDDWYGTHVERWLLRNENGAARRYRYSPVRSGDSRDGNDPAHRTILSCYQLLGYNYSLNDPEGTYWTESLGCGSEYLPEDVYSGWNGVVLSGSGGTGAPVMMPVVVGGGNVIANVTDYFKCFSNVAGSDHRYSVKVCVDQPVPGTRTTWGFAQMPDGSPVNVGHTFLVLTERVGTKTVVRNVGFYPLRTVHPLSPTSQGQLHNNETSLYDVSVEVGVTNSQFRNLLTFIAQGNNVGFLYDLNNNNCTSFVIGGLASIGISLPRTTGYWTGGGGFNPGDLGEDIRKMKLESNMTRDTYNNGHPNVGTCY